MNRVIKLLSEKNHYLEKFLTLNEEECIRIKSSDYDNLDKFYQTREQILEIIRYIDAELVSVSERINSSTASAAEKKTVQEALAIKDEYVTRILDQDLEVLSCIEKAKSEIIVGLRSIRKDKKSISGYRSIVNRQGTLNEKY